MTIQLVNWNKDNLNPNIFLGTGRYNIERNLYIGANESCIGWGFSLSMGIKTSCDGFENFVYPNYQQGDNLTVIID